MPVLIPSVFRPLCQINSCNEYQEVAAANVLRGYNSRILLFWSINPRLNTSLTVAKTKLQKTYLNCTTNEKGTAHLQLSEQILRCSEGKNNGRDCVAVVSVASGTGSPRPYMGQVGIEWGDGGNYVFKLRIQIPYFNTPSHLLSPSLSAWSPHDIPVSCVFLPAFSCLYDAWDMLRSPEPVVTLNGISL